MSSTFDASLGVTNFPTLCLWFKSLADELSPVQPVFDVKSAILRLPADQQQSLTEEFRSAWASELHQAVETASPYLPLVYQEGYVEPLLRSLQRVVRSHDNVIASQERAELLAGAVTQHAWDSPVRQGVRQFLAVVSNLYCSFLAPDKRVAAKIPLGVPTLPPLTVFHHAKKDSNTAGPVTFTSAMTRVLCGSEVAVIGLPGGYHRAPLAWAPLAHETTGHAVLQADPGILPDLIDGIRALFGCGPVTAGGRLRTEQQLGLLWSHWAEEAASDVYGLLNIGPAFAINLAALLASHRSQNPAIPQMAVQSLGNHDAELGPHPIDLLRLYLAIGAIESLGGLARKYVGFYTALLEGIADLCARNSLPPSRLRKIEIRGRVQVEKDFWTTLQLSLPFSIAADSARRVGAFIASIRLNALGNHTIQDVETWDNGDEEIARAICNVLLDPPKVWRSGEDGPGSISQVSVAHAMRELDPPLTPERAHEVEKALKGARFSDLTKAELAEFQAVNPIPLPLRLALSEGRIEEFWKVVPAAPQSVSYAQLVQLDLIATAGDDAHLLAGSILAAIADPSMDSLHWINQRLAYGLTRSFHHDQVVGSATLHEMFDTNTAPAIVTVSPESPTVPNSTVQSLHERRLTESF